MFCHDCFHWMIPLENQCTECGSHFDVSEPDPDIEFINFVTGEHQREIGFVAIDRSRFPSQGKLSMTENGFLFNPLDSYDHKPPFLIKKQTRKSLRFALSFFSESSASDYDISAGKQNSLYSLPAETSIPRLSPGESLLSHPGTFFISFEAVTSIQKMFYRWKLDRTYGRSLLIKPVSDRSRFYFDMQEISRNLSTRKYSLNNL